MRGVAQESSARGTPCESTLATYRRLFERFERTCRELGVDSLPASADGALMALARLFESGASLKTTLTVATAANYVHIAAGYQVPCPHSALIKSELRHRFPARFEAQSLDESHSWREERAATLEVLEGLAQQTPTLAKLCGILVRLVSDGRHLQGAPQVLFAHQRVEGELQTKCRVCGELVSVGLLASSDELAEHTCDVVFRVRDEEESA